MGALPPLLFISIFNMLYIISLASHNVHCIVSLPVTLDNQTHRGMQMYSILVIISNLSNFSSLTYDTYSFICSKLIERCLFLVLGWKFHLTRTTRFVVFILTRSLDIYINAITFSHTALLFTYGNNIKCTICYLFALGAFYSNIDLNRK